MFSFIINLDYVLTFAMFSNFSQTFRDYILPQYFTHRNASYSEYDCSWFLNYIFSIEF